MLTVFSRLPKSSTWHSYVCVQWRKYLILGAFLLSSVFAGGGKYSKESNQLKKETTLGSNTEPEVKRPDGPFRVAKLNAVWDKAQRVRRTYYTLQAEINGSNVFLYFRSGCNLMIFENSWMNYRSKVSTSRGGWLYFCAKSPDQ